MIIVMDDYLGETSYIIFWRHLLFFFYITSVLHLFYFAGLIERRFIEVPHGATWVEATMRTSGFDTARRFFIDAVQVSCMTGRFERLVLPFFFGMH